MGDDADPGADVEAEGTVFAGLVLRLGGSPEILVVDVDRDLRATGDHLELVAGVAEIDEADRRLGPLDHAVVSGFVLLLQRIDVSRELVLALAGDQEVVAVYS